jgi:hypothetical protein
MKIEGLKKIIKEAVREAIQEELKDILLEAVRIPKTPIGVGGYGTVTETITTPPPTFTPPTMTAEQQRNAYAQILGDMSRGTGTDTITLTTDNLNQFRAQPVDTINGSLPSGEVGLDLIQNLMNSK